MKKRFLALTGIALSSAMLLTACGGGSSAPSLSNSKGAYADSAVTSDSAYYDDYDYEHYPEETTTTETAAEYDEGYDEFGTSSGAVADTVDDSASVSEKKKVDNNRKLIKTVNLDVETKEFDQLINTLETQVDMFDGYVESQNTWNGTYYDYYGRYTDPTARNASYTIRVPRENLDTFLESFSPLCNVKSKSESVEDITLSYVDLESHKAALETEEQTLLQLMEEATEMYDILTIEDKITDIRYQLQSMESQLRTYDNKVTYSTVYMTITEVKELTIVEPEPETFWDRLSKRFKNSMTNMGDGFQNFIIWFIAALPHLILWGGIIFGIAMGVRAIVKYNIKKSRKRREEAAKNSPAQPQGQFIYGQQPVVYGYAPVQVNTAAKPAQAAPAQNAKVAPAQEEKKDAAAEEKKEAVTEEKKN